MDHEYAQHTMNLLEIELAAPESRFRREWQAGKELERNEAKTERALERLRRAASRVASA